MAGSLAVYGMHAYLQIRREGWRDGWRKVIGEGGCSEVEVGRDGILYVCFSVCGGQRGRVRGAGSPRPSPPGTGKRSRGGFVTRMREQYRRIYAAYYTDNEGYVQKVDKIAELGPDQVHSLLAPPEIAAPSQRSNSCSSLRRCTWMDGAAPGLAAFFSCFFFFFFFFFCCFCLLLFISLKPGDE